MKRIVERIEKMTDVVFSDEWQNKFFTWSFGIMCAIYDKLLHTPKIKRPKA